MSKKTKGANYRKYFLIGIILLLVLGLIVMVQHFFLSNTTHLQNISPSITYPPPSPQEVTEYPLVSPKPENSNLSTWKTYTSQTVGYTFKVPANWDAFHIEANPRTGYTDHDYNFAFVPKDANGKEQHDLHADDYALVQIQFPLPIDQRIYTDNPSTNIEGRPTYIDEGTSALNPPRGFRGSWIGGNTHKDVYISAGYTGIFIHISGSWNKGIPSFKQTFDTLITTIHFTRSHFMWNAPPISFPH